MPSPQFRRTLRILAHTALLLSLQCASLCRAHASSIQALSIQAPSIADATPSALPPAVFDLARHADPVVSLDGLWRFHTGDDPSHQGWANPAFDDTTWPLIRSDQSWSTQGYPNYGGAAWYRAKVLLPANHQPLSLYIPQVATNYQLFADGKLIATFGAMPPQARSYYASVPFAYPLPAESGTAGNTLTLAIRVWQAPHWARAYGGGLLGGIRLGATALIDDRDRLEIHDMAWHQVDGIFLAMFETLAGLAALALFALRTQQREYLWFGIWLILSGAIRCFFVYTAFHPISRTAHDLVWQTLFTGATLASIAFYFRFLHGERSRLFWLAIASIPANILLLTAGSLELISVALWIEIGIALTLPVALWSIHLLIRRAIQGLPDARLLCVPVLLQQLVAFTIRTLNLGYRTSWYSIPATWVYSTANWPFQFNLQDAADALFLIGMLAILIQRFSRTSRQEDDHQRERDAARSVQQLLIAEAIPTLPGLALQSVYKPAGQVGGDFFQILPIEEDSGLSTHTGSVLIAIGDVSGKGLAAAMTVSLLVGTLRALAQTIHHPGALLAVANQAMVARSRGGFTTCLILRADPGGALTIANAGHIAPYLNGVELTIQNGLPLGLVANASYPETTLQLSPNQQLTLLTDGVVEARSKSRELFGFDRTQSISKNSAEFIAESAQNFGQDDDITVLTLTRHQSP